MARTSASIAQTPVIQPELWPSTGGSHCQRSQGRNPGAPTTRPTSWSSPAWRLNAELHLWCATSARVKISACFVWHYVSVTMPCWILKQSLYFPNSGAGSTWIGDYKGTVRTKVFILLSMDCGMYWGGVLTEPNETQPLYSATLHLIDHTHKVTLDTNKRWGVAASRCWRRKRGRV